MRDYISLGSAPCDENCIQVDSNKDYVLPMKEECQRYKKLLEKRFPIPENLKDRVKFGIKAFTHEFGMYYEVCIVFDNDNKEEVEFAFDVENDLPFRWEEEEVLTNLVRKETENE